MTNRTPTKATQGTLCHQQHFQPFLHCLASWTSRTRNFIHHPQLSKSSSTNQQETNQSHTIMTLYTHQLHLKAFLEAVLCLLNIEYPKHYTSVFVSNIIKSHRPTGDQAKPIPLTLYPPTAPPILPRVCLVSLEHWEPGTLYFTHSCDPCLT